MNTELYHAKLFGKDPKIILEKKCQQQNQMTLKMAF